MKTPIKKRISELERSSTDAEIPEIRVIWDDAELNPGDENVRIVEWPDDENGQNKRTDG